VVTNAGVYYLDKLKTWPTKFIDKKIKVCGRLVIKQLTKINYYCAGITSGEIRIIKKPKFALSIE
jgi:hypothetical protein